MCDGREKGPHKGAFDVSGVQPRVFHMCISLVGTYSVNNRIHCWVERKK